MSQTPGRRTRSRSRWTAPAAAVAVAATLSPVAWVLSRPAPDAGSTVLTGHADAAGEGPGALLGLREVEVGTQVTVRDVAGGEHVHEVVGRETVVPVDLV